MEATTIIRFIVWNIDSQEKAKDVAPIAEKLEGLMEKGKYFILVLTECHKDVADAIVTQVTKYGPLSLFSDDYYPADGGIQFIYQLPEGWRLNSKHSESITYSNIITDPFIPSMMMNKKANNKHGNNPEYVALEFIKWLYSTKDLNDSEGALLLFHNFLKNHGFLQNDPELSKKLRFVYLIDDANQVKMLLGGVHFWAKNDEVKNIERNQDLIRHVYHYLDREAYPHKDKCALMGDFNMNPYEPLLYKNHEPELPNTYSSELLILSNQEIIKKHYPDWFYNPCWNLLGDQFSKINYTYSAKIAKQRKYEKIFNVFDGVLLRKELFEVFQLPTLKIENTGDVSDHFPVIFEMEFNMTNL